MPNPNGAPPKISPEIIKKIVNAMRGGAYVETAAVLAGVDKTTLYRWLKKGARSRKSIYGQLCHAVELAHAEYEMRDVMVIDAAAQKGDWRAALARLERKFPKRWGRTEKIEIAGPDGGPIPISEMTDEQVEARYKQLQEKMLNERKGKA